MFGKVIVFGLFEMIPKNEKKKEKKKSEDRVWGPGLAFELGWVRRRRPSHF